MVKDHQNFKELSDAAKRLYDFYAGYCDENSVIRMPLLDNDAFQELIEQSFIICIDNKYILINNYYYYIYILSLQALLTSNKKINNIILSKEYSSLFERKEREKKGFSRFTPPTLEELDAFIKENHLDVSADKFFDYYSSCGWTVGRNKPMKDWKAACRNWSRRQTEFKKSTKTSGPTHDETWADTFFRAAVNRSMGGHK